MAVVFITKVENGEQKQEGICIKCAKELGIGPVNEIIKNMGLSDEDIDRMSEDMAGIMEGLEKGENPFGGDVSEALQALGADATNAPSLDINSILRDGMKAGGAESADKGPKKKKEEKKFLTTYCQNITEKASMGLLDRVIGRERELDRVIQILSRRQKNNPCLIGEPGVGKTAIAEALASKIVSGDVP